MNKTNKSNKFNTLKEVIEALKRIDKYAGLYLWDNFDEEDFQNGFGYSVGALREYSNGPLDFFDWFSNDEFDWYSLNIQLKQTDTVNKINLNDYTTKDIDFIGCNPDIAKALKKGKSILCKVENTHCARQLGGGIFCETISKKVMVDKYAGEDGYMAGINYYESAEPIKKTKTELRVKNPVSIMQYLIDSGYVFDDSGFFRKGDERYCPKSLFAYCGWLVPKGWPFPELLEEVAVKCEHEDEMDDPSNTVNLNHKSGR